MELASDNLNDAIFIINYNDHVRIAETLHKKHSSIKYIYILHYFTWLWEFQSDIRLFTKQMSSNAWHVMSEGVRNMFRRNDNALTVNCLGSSRAFETQLTKAMLTLLYDPELATQLGQMPENAIWSGITPIL